LFAIIHSLTRPTIFTEAACLAVALIIAEAFYKFHSFTLEALAFLVTWYGLGAAAVFIRRLLNR